MKIAFIADSFLLDQSTGVNGTQVQLYNLAQAFKRRGIEVHYVALTGKLQKDCEVIAGIKLRWIKQRNGIFSWIYYMVDYFSILNQIQPDVIFQRGRSYLTYVAGEWSRKNGKKFIWGTNGEDGCDFWKNMKRLMKSRSSLWKKRLLSPNALLQDIFIHRGIRRTEIAINQTENQKRKLWNNFRKKGIVITSYFPVAEDGLGPRKKEKAVFWLANLSPGKQPEVFLKLAEHCQDCEGWEFVLGGGTMDKVYFEKISEQAKLLRNVDLVGRIPFEESNEFFSKVSLFVNTSIMEAEGIPNTFIQAWLSSTPVLSLVHDPNGWIKRHNLGFCAEGNLSDFLEKGKTLISNENALVALGENGRNFALNKFAREKIIDAYIRLFRVRCYGK